LHYRNINLQLNISGKLHLRVDFLSRFPVDLPECYEYAACIEHGVKKIEELDFSEEQNKEVL
jgi:hypothetical protein